MTQTLTQIHKLLGAAIVLCICLVFVFLGEKNNIQSFVYGLSVGLMNLVLSSVLYHAQQARVPKYIGYSLVFVVNSTLMRWLVAGLLLVAGFSQCVPIMVIIGFVCGQCIHIINQLIKVSKRYVK